MINLNEARRQLNTWYLKNPKTSVFVKDLNRFYESVYCPEIDIIVNRLHKLSGITETEKMKKKTLKSLNSLICNLTLHSEEGCYTVVDRGMHKVKPEFIRAQDLLKETGCILIYKGYREYKKGPFKIGGKKTTLEVLPFLIDVLEKFDIYFYVKKKLNYIKPSSLEMRDKKGHSMEIKTKYKKEKEYVSEMIYSQEDQFRLLDEISLSICNTIVYNTRYSLLMSQDFDPNLSESSDSLLVFSESRNLVRFAIQGRIFDLRNKYPVRIFNENLKRGGRFFVDYQFLPKWIRPYLLINENETQERDFSCCLPLMLYHLEGIDYREDAYEIAGYDRKEVKENFYVVLNSTSESIALQEYKKSLQENKLSSKEYIQVSVARKKYLFYLIQQKHLAVSENFWQGKGLEMQKLESDITANIKDYFVKRGVLVLDWHDSYRIESEYIRELEFIMRDMYFRAFKFEPMIH